MGSQQSKQSNYQLSRDLIHTKKKATEMLNSCYNQDRIAWEEIMDGKHPLIMDVFNYEQNLPKAKKAMTSILRRLNNCVKGWEQLDKDLKDLCIEQNKIEEAKNKMIGGLGGFFAGAAVVGGGVGVGALVVGGLALLLGGPLHLAGGAAVLAGVGIGGGVVAALYSVTLLWKLWRDSSVNKAKKKANAVSLKLLIVQGMAARKQIKDCLNRLELIKVEVLEDDDRDNSRVEDQKKYIEDEMNKWKEMFMNERATDGKLSKSKPKPKQNEA